MIKKIIYKLINKSTSYFCISPNVTLLILMLIAINSINSATANNLPNFGNETQSIISKKEEIIIGKTWLHQIRHAGMIDPDPIVSAYINHLGNSLLANANQVDLSKFNFFIVPGDEVNAFAFFGGNIGVFSGLINITETESELAAILAHEISHITQKHSARQLLQQKKLMPLTIAEAAAAIAIGVPDLVLPVLGGHIQQMLTFSRENEQEADRIGIQLLNKSKFDPRAMANIFQRFSQINTELQKTPEYLLTHPMFESRIPDAYNRTEQTSYRQFVDHIDYGLIKARIKNNLTANKTNLLTQIENRLKNHRYSNYTVLRYEQALVLQDLHKTTLAINIFKELIEKNPENIIIQLSFSQLLATTEPILAKNKLANLMQISPDYLPLILTYAQTLLTLNLPLDAKNVLQQYNKNHIYDLIEEPKIYELLLGCSQKLNEQDESLFAQTKLLILNNNLSAAEQKIELALQASKKPNINKIKKFKAELEKFIKDTKEISI